MRLQVTYAEDNGHRVNDSLVFSLFRFSKRAAKPGVRLPNVMVYCLQEQQFHLIGEAYSAPNPS